MLRLLLCVFAVAVLAAQNVVVQLPAVADVSMESTRNTSSNGLGPTLCVGSESGDVRRAVVLFSDELLAGLDPSLLLSAVVRLTVVDAGSVSPSLAVLTTGFVESQTGLGDPGCEVFPTPADETSWLFPWANAGGDFGALIQLTRSVTENSVQVLEWDVTSLVSDWMLDLAPNSGFIIVADSSSFWAVASANAAAAASRPSLVATFEPSVIAGTPGCYSVMPPSVCTSDIKQIGAQPDDFCGWCETEDGSYQWHFCSTPDAECSVGELGVGECQTIIYREVGFTCGGENVVCEDGEFDVVCNDNGICGVADVFMPNEECSLEHDPEIPVNSGCISTECLEVVAGKPPVCSYIASGGDCSRRQADCVATDYCSDAGECVPRGAGQAACSNQLQCQANFQCIEGACVAVGSVAIGGACINDFSCSTGLACGSDDSKCFEVVLGAACSDENPCPRAEYQCACNFKTGARECWYPLIGEKSREYVAEALSCIAEHADAGCALEQSFWKANCQGQNCKSEIVNARRAVADDTAAYDNGLKQHGSSAAALVVAPILAFVLVMLQL